MAYVPPHLRGAGRAGGAPSRPDPGSAEAQGAASQAREGRAAALGVGGDRWGGGSGGGGGGGSGGGWGGGRSREDRSYEYRADAGAPLTHPTDEQGGVGECFGTVVRREAAEHPPLQPDELEAVAAAAAALPTATAGGEEDGEEGEDERGTAVEPFFDAFLAAAVPTDGTEFFSQLASSKQRLARQDDRVWQMRDTPKVSFIGQFYNCMREVDRATGLSRMHLHSALEGLPDRGHVCVEGPPTILLSNERVRCLCAF